MPNSVLDRYRKYLTNKQITTLRNLYGGIRQTYADERRDAYLEARGAINRVGAVASTMGLGQGYVARKQAMADRELDKYGAKLDKAADERFESLTKQEANKTIRARHRAAQSAQQAAIDAMNARLRAKSAEDRQKNADKNYLDWLNSNKVTVNPAKVNQQPRYGRGLLDYLNYLDRAAGDHVKPDYTPREKDLNADYYSMDKAVAGQKYRGGKPDYTRGMQEIMTLDDRIAGQKYRQQASFTIEKGKTNVIVPKELSDDYVAALDRAKSDPDYLNTVKQDYFNYVKEYFTLFENYQKLDGQMNNLSAIRDRFNEDERAAMDMSLPADQRRAAAMDGRLMADKYNAQANEVSKLPLMRSAMQTKLTEFFEDPNFVIAKAVLSEMGEEVDAFDLNWVLQYGDIPAEKVDDEFWEKADAVPLEVDWDKRRLTVKDEDRQWFAEHGYEDLLNRTLASIPEMSKSELSLRARNLTLGSIADAYMGDTKYSGHSAPDGYYVIRRAAKNIEAFESLSDNEKVAKVKQGEDKTNLSLLLKGYYARQWAKNKGMTKDETVWDQAGVLNKFREALGVPDDYFTETTIKYLTPEDVAYIDYLVAEGKQKDVKEYLYNITSAANMAEGQNKADSISVLGGFSEFFFNVVHGIQQHFENIGNLFRNEKAPVGVWDAAAQGISENQRERGWGEKWSNVFNSGSTSLGGMLPDIATTWLTGPLAGSAKAAVSAGKSAAANALLKSAGWLAENSGLLLMSASAAGGSKMQALREGRRPDDATVYGLVSGLSEFALEKYLGGIIGLSDKGVVRKLATNVGEKMKAPFARALIKLGIENVGEMAEEYVGEIIDPLVENLVYNENNKFRLYTREAGEAALSALFSTVLLNGVSSIHTFKQERAISDVQKKAKCSYADAETFLRVERFIAGTSNEVPTKAQMELHNRLAAQVIAGDLNGLIEGYKPDIKTTNESKDDSALYNWFKNQAEATQYEDGTKIPDAERAKNREAYMGMAEDYLEGKVSSYSDGPVQVVTVNGKTLDRSQMSAQEKILYSLTQKMATAFPNVKFVVHDTLPTANGLITGDGTVHIALDSVQKYDAAASYVLAHELTHALKKGDNAAWAEMRSKIEDYFKSTEAGRVAIARAEATALREAQRAAGRSEAAREQAEMTDEEKAALKDKLTTSDIYQDEYASVLAEQFFSDPVILNDFLDSIIKDKEMDRTEKKGFIQKVKDLLEKAISIFRKQGRKVPKDMQECLDVVKDKLSKLNEGDALDVRIRNRRETLQERSKTDESAARVQRKEREKESHQRLQSFLNDSSIDRAEMETEAEAREDAEDEELDRWRFRIGLAEAEENMAREAEERNLKAEKKAEKEKARADRYEAKEQAKEKRAKDKKLNAERDAILKQFAREDAAKAKAEKERQKAEEADLQRILTEIKEDDVAQVAIDSRNSYFSEMEKRAKAATEEWKTQRAEEAKRYSAREYTAEEAQRIVDNINEKRKEAANLRREISELQSDGEYRRLYNDMLFIDPATDEFSEAAKQLRAYSDKIGLTEKAERAKAFEEELRKNRSELEDAEKVIASNKEQNAVRESGLSEADYFRKQALKEFGTTPYFYDAGYILPDGKMLNLSGEKGRHFGSRGQDHRAVGTIYEATTGSEAMLRFMSDGNIRIMAESPGLDIISTVAPTTAQYSKIRDFIRQYAKEEYFNIDFTDERGNTVDNLEYEGNISPTRIINDIKAYYETGEANAESLVSQFHRRYSTRDGAYMALAEKYRDGTATKEETTKLHSMVVQAALQNSFKPVDRFHQTAKDNNFTRFSTDNPVAARYDSETPNGIFLKDNDHFIPLGMTDEAYNTKQMKMWISTKNMLSFANRDAANKWYCKNIDGYEALQNEMKKAFAPIEKRLDDLQDSWFEAAKNDNEEELSRLDAEEEDLVEQLGKVENEYRAKLRGLLNDYFLKGNSGYDGIELGFDGARYVDGKKENVHTYIVFSPSQIKSADPVTYDSDGNIIPLSERFRTDRTGEDAWKNEDIRYSRRDVSGVVPATRSESRTLDMLDDRNIARYYNEVDDVLSRTAPTGSLVMLGRPSALLKKYLGNDNMLYIVQSAIYKAVLPNTEPKGKHGLGKDVIYGLPEEICDPLAITGNTTKHAEASDNSIVVWTSWQTVSGEPVIVPIRIGVDGKTEIYNNINTVFNAFNTDYVEDLLRKGNVLYTKDNKNIHDLLTQERKVLKAIGQDVSKETIPHPSNEVNHENRRSIRYNRTALLEESTVDKYLNDYASSNPDYAQAYIVWMTPTDFLNLTASRAGKEAVRSTSRKLDVSLFKEATRHQPFQLSIDTETGEVTGHEGRHRSVALDSEGIERIPVLLFDSANKYSKQKMDSLVLHGQDFGNGNRSYADVTVRDVIPLSRANRDEIIEKFTKAPALEQFKEKNGYGENLRYSFRADSDIALWNPPNVDTKGIYEAVKNGSGKVDGRFDVTVDTGNNGFNVTIKDTRTGETYKDGGTVEAGENAEAFAERYTAAIIRNIKSGKPESTSRSTAGIYIEKGEKPTYDVNIPVHHVDEKGNVSKNSKFARTLAEAGLSQKMHDRVVDDTYEGLLSYTPSSNKEVYNSAIAKVESDMSGAVTEFNKAVDGWKIPTPEEIALGEALLWSASQSGNIDEAMEIACNLQDAFTKMGQGDQAARIMKTLGAAGAYYYINKQMAKINDELNKAAKRYQLKMNPALVKRLLNATDYHEIRKALEAIRKDLGRQLKPTLHDWLTAWKYTAMLGNIKTIARNFVGNFGFIPAVMLKNVINTTLQSGYYATIGRKNAGDKTAKLFASEKYRDFAKWDWNDQVKYDIKGNKYAVESNQIKQYLRFDNPKHAFFKPAAFIFEKWRSATARAMEEEKLGGDMMFKKLHYDHTLATYLQTKNVNVNDLKTVLGQSRNGRHYEADSYEGELLATYNKATAYAREQANKNTYNNLNAFASILSNMSRKMYNYKRVNLKSGKATHPLRFGYYLLEGLLPFKNTPANIVVRAAEYSPLGLAKSLTWNWALVAKGKISANEFIEKISSGLSGTAIFVLGAILAKMGLIRGGFGDDKEDSEDKRLGHQAYSLEIGNISITLDWLAPEAIPLFMGVEFIDSIGDLSEKAWEDKGLSALLNMMTKSFEPMLNMSMLSGVNALFEGSRAKDGLAPIEKAVSTMMTSYITQFQPTLLAQLARTIDPTRRSYYHYKDSHLPAFLDKFVQTAMKKIPGLTFLLKPYVDEWGNQDSEPRWWLNAIENFISPAYINTVKETAPDSEIARLYDRIGDTSVFPSPANKTVTFEGEKYNLTAQEYTAYATLRGQTAYALVDKMITTEAYNNLTDAQKVEAIVDAYKYADAVAKAAYLETKFGKNVPLSEWQGKAYDYSRLPQGKGAEDIRDYILLRSILKDEEFKYGNDPDATTNEMKFGYIMGSQSLNNWQKMYLIGAYGIKKNYYANLKTAAVSGYDINKCVNVAAFAYNESGAGKKARIIEYAMSLGFNATQAAALYEWFK